jgi:hypothetical protein
VMVHLDVSGPEHRKSRLAGAASLALHGAAVWLLIALGCRQPVPQPRGSAVTPIPLCQRD